MACNLPPAATVGGAGGADAVGIAAGAGAGAAGAGAGAGAVWPVNTWPVNTERFCLTGWFFGENG